MSFFCVCLLLVIFNLLFFFLFLFVCCGYSENSILINQELLTDLMEQLEIAISSGEHKKAALLARELALRKVACTLQRSTQQTNITAQPIVYVDDYKIIIFMNLLFFMA